MSNDVYLQALYRTINAHQTIFIMDQIMDSYPVAALLFIMSKVVSHTLRSLLLAVLNVVLVVCLSHVITVLLLFIHYLSWFV